MGGIDRDACRRCLGNGNTNYYGVTIRCPDCLGTGNRRIDAGDMITDGRGGLLATLQYAGDGSTLIAVAEPGVRLLPEQWEVDMARRENAQRRGQED